MRAVASHIHRGGPALIHPHRSSHVQLRQSQRNQDVKMQCNCLAKRTRTREMCVCVCLRVLVCVCVCVLLCVYVCVCLCVCVCMCVQCISCSSLSHIQHISHTWWIIKSASCRALMPDVGSSRVLPSCPSAVTSSACAAPDTVSKRSPTAVFVACSCRYMVG